MGDNRRREVIELGYDEAIISSDTGKLVEPVKRICGQCARGRHGASCEGGMCKCECRQQ